MSSDAASAFGTTIETTARALPAERRRGGRVPFLLLIAFLFVLYSHPGLLVPPVEVLRPAALLGLLAVGTALGTRMLQGRPIVLPWPQGYGMVALLAVAAISSFHALWPRYAFLYTMDLVRIAAIFLVVVNVVDSRRRLWLLLVTLMIAGTIPAAGALTGFGVRQSDAIGRAGWIGNYANPNDLAFNLIALVPLALVIGITGRVRERLVAWPALALYLAAIFFSYSRGGLVGLLAVLVLAAFRERGIWPRLLATVGIAAAVIFVTTFWARDQGFTDLANDPTVMQRLETIDVGTRMWLSNPVFGVGPGCSILGWPLYAPASMTMSGGWLHNHNTYVQALSETGLLGFLAVATIIGATLLRTRRLRRYAIEIGDRKLERVSGALDLSLWAFLACSLSSGLLFTWIPYLVVGAVCALARIERQAAEQGRAVEWPR